ITTTTTLKGVDPNGRNSSRILRPPGGGSNFTLGFDEPTEQPVKKNKKAPNIFGTSEENQPSWAKSAGAQSTRDNSEPSGLQRRNSSEAGSGDILGPKGEGDAHENVEADFQVYLGQNDWHGFHSPFFLTSVSLAISPTSKHKFDSSTPGNDCHRI
uniref:Jupiter microtubule associated homolog 1 n=1 Tax=Vombatus ursinus TaxID=29139 RepID=A0A4X2LG11_VOMUR